MAGYERAAIVADDDEQFDTRALVRLAAWGMAAAMGLFLAVLGARTDLGGQRLHAALKAIAATPEEAQSTISAQLLARTMNAEREARRASDTVLALSADRERMSSRVGVTEREIADLTSSVQRALAIAAGNQFTSPSLSISSDTLLFQPRNLAPEGWMAASGSRVQSAGEPVPNHIAGAERAPEPVLPQNVPLPRPAPQAVASNAPLNPSPAASAPSQAKPATTPDNAAKPAVEDNTSGATGAIPATVEPSPKVEFGVDLGPALTMARLRARWSKLASERPDLMKGLRPLVTVRDTGPGKPVEVRLVAGPMADVNAATEFCVALASPGYVCRPSVFDGQRLAVQ